MFDLLLAASCCCLPISAPPAPSLDAAVQAQAHDDKPLRALEAWMKLWRNDKIEFRKKRDRWDEPHEWASIGKDSVAVKFGLAPKNAVGNITWKSDLQMILDAVVKLDNAEAAQALLEVAAVGIDPSKYTIEMAAYDVRSLGEDALAKLQSAAAKEEIASAARGSAKVDKNKILGVQAAAVRCLGRMNDKSYRSVIEAALNDNDEIVRVHAAEALGALAMEESGLALVSALDRETNDAVLAAVAHSLQTIFAKYLTLRDSAPAADAGKESKPAEPAEKSEKNGGAPPAEPAPASSPAVPAAPAPAAASAELPEVLRLVVGSGIRALGRSNWRADMALVRLLGDFRSIETVPALIAILERFRDKPDDVKSGKLSGLLLYQTHELLVSMTGAVFPATSPEKWREFWEKEKDKIQVTKKRETGLDKTMAGGFCGIPVQGTRVVFVVDVSLSMEWKMDKVEVDGRKTLVERLDFAKKELCRAMDVIAPNAMFNLLTFCGDEKPELWKKEMVLATEPNRKLFKQYVEGLRARPGTNIWAGLQEALKIKSLVYGTRYESNVDEIFILSDGAPTQGEVQDPIEMLRLVHEANKFANMRINTIFISSATPLEEQRRQPKMEITPQELMKRMAEENGGKFREL